MKQYFLYILLMICLLSLAWYGDKQKQEEITYPGFDLRMLKDTCKNHKNPPHQVVKKLWGYLNEIPNKIVFIGKTSYILVDNKIYIKQ